MRRRCRRLSDGGPAFHGELCHFCYPSGAYEAHCRLHQAKLTSFPGREMGTEMITQGFNNVPPE
jgi:hypothetical protein